MCKTKHVKNIPLKILFLLINFNSVAIMGEPFYKLPKVLFSQEFADRLMLFF